MQNVEIVHAFDTLFDSLLACSNLVQLKFLHDKHIEMSSLLQGGCT